MTYAALSAVSAAVDVAYATFGVDATYTACDADGVAVKALVTESLASWGEDISITNASIGIEMRRSEVAEKPRRGDIVIVGAITYRIDQALLSNTDLEWRVLAVRNDC